MPSPTPVASAATVSAALERLVSNRARWAGALADARDQHAARPVGWLALITAWRAQPVVALATGLWAAWARRRARAATPPAVTAAHAGLLWRGASVATGVVRRHPVLALSFLALALAWAGWRHRVARRSTPTP